MPPEFDDEAQREAEQIERQMQVMQRHRPDTEMRTRAAIRRVPLVLATAALVALALWYWMMR